MKRYKRILVPVDGSKLSDLAFDQAISLAKMVDGVVTVIHVMEPLQYDFTPYVGQTVDFQMGIIG